MVTLLVGPKGSGKTKLFVESVNEAMRKTKGSVACVEKGTISTFRVSHKVRLVDADEFDVVCYEHLYGLLAGLCAGNYDITDIFVDATLRIGGRNMTELCGFIGRLNRLSKEHNVNFTLTISAKYNTLPQEITKWATVQRVG